jgi:GNAT superfamily N-acetyltransferase
VELRPRKDDDLDECERLARAVHAADGYPPRCANDLRGFISTPDALEAWVVESATGIVGHVALQPTGSPAVTALACDATARSPDQLCVVARLFVSPSHRGKGLGSSLLAAAAEAGRARGLWPILDVAAHFATAIRLYENAGWICAGRVTVPFPGEEPLDELVYVGPAPDGAGR